MFAWKSMDGNSSLVKLKLDMVYRELSTETASNLFTEITRPAQPATEEKPKPKEAPAAKKKVIRKVVKAAESKSVNTK